MHARLIRLNLRYCQRNPQSLYFATVAGMAEWSLVFAEMTFWGMAGPVIRVPGQARRACVVFGQPPNWPPRHSPHFAIERPLRPHPRHRRTWCGDPADRLSVAAIPLRRKGGENRVRGSVPFVPSSLSVSRDQPGTLLAAFPPSRSRQDPRKFFEQISPDSNQV